MSSPVWSPQALARELPGVEFPVDSLSEVSISTARSELSQSSNELSPRPESSDLINQLIGLSLSQPPSPSIFNLKADEVSQVPAHENQLHHPKAPLNSTKLPRFLEMPSPDFSICGTFSGTGWTGSRWLKCFEHALNHGSFHNNGKG